VLPIVPEVTKFVIASDPESFQSSCPERPKQTSPPLLTTPDDWVPTMQTVKVVPDPVVDPVNEELPLKRIAGCPPMAFVVKTDVPA
jgi:hypothetical protein